MSASTSAPAERPSVWKYLYNHNPFYVISTLLMLFSIRSAYGTLEIGAINTSFMMGVLAAYTLVLGVVGVLIVRWGKVWEDARSVILLVLLMFLAVSICADDLFVNVSTVNAGAGLMLFGFLFSSSVSEAVLRWAKIRLGIWYRIPYHLMLALFYLAPWMCTPELHPRSRPMQEWLLFSFPVTAGVLFLCLLPAVRRGREYAAENGTPWGWPLFPWTAFGLIAFAVALRSYALTMTYGFIGPIWRDAPSGKKIVFETIWGPYFLVPLAFAILVLLLEAGFVLRSRQLVTRVLLSAPALLLMSIPMADSRVFLKFLTRFVDTVGSPIWLTVLLLIGLYAWAWIRGVRGAIYGVAGAIALLTFIGPRTIGSGTLVPAQYWPALIIAGMLFVFGLWKRSSPACAGAAVAGSIALWFALPDTVLANYRLITTFHILWGTILALGLMFRDEFAAVLRAVSAMVVPVSAFAALTSSTALEIPVAWRLTYIGVLAAASLVIAGIWRTSWFYTAFVGTAAVMMYAGVAITFRWAADQLGRSAVTAFAWSLGMLMLAFLISAHKARWLQSSALASWWSSESPGPNGDAT